ATAAPCLPRAERVFAGMLAIERFLRAPACAFFTLRRAACVCFCVAMFALPSHGPLELGLVHLRPAADALLLGFVVELIACAAARTAMRAQATATSRRDVLHRRPARLLGLSRAGPFFVDCAGSDLFRGVLGLTPLAQPVLDVL